MNLEFVETPFAHNFNEGESKVHEMNGYIQALTAVLKYVEKETEFKPEKRLIDAVVLLDKIKATCKELQPMLSEELIIILKQLQK